MRLTQRGLLLNEETIQRFGHSVLGLRPSSNKRIVHKCDSCGKPKENVYEHFFVGRGLSCQKCKHLKQKKTNLTKYGVENVSQHEEIKKKKIQTALNHFGVEYAHQLKEFKERRRQVCLEKYGVENPSQAQSIKDKKIQTSMEHFGVEYPCQVKEIKEKQQTTFRKTWLKKQGVEDVENPQATILLIQKRLQEEGYKLLSDKYLNCRALLEVQCPKGDVYWVSWNNHTQGSRCPTCNESRGERELKKILERLYPGKVRQYDGLGFLGKQKVDFSIQEEKLVFEFDGEQHYKVLVGAFNTCFTLKEAQERLRVQKKRDRRKNRLCKKNGYTLIRIRYDEELTLESVQKKIKKGMRKW